MADDTRQPRADLSREALTVNQENKPFTGQQWKDAGAKTYTPPENANLMSEGASLNTAGGKIPEVTLWNAIRGDGAVPMKEFHKRPCNRESLLTGMGSGFAFGGVRALAGGNVWASCNYAVAGFCMVSFGMYQWCYYRRRAEKEGMTRAVEILNRKAMEKAATEQRKEKEKEERRQAKDREQDAQLAALREAGNSSGKSWWKFW